MRSSKCASFRRSGCGTCGTCGTVAPCVVRNSFVATEVTVPTEYSLDPEDVATVVGVSAFTEAAYNVWVTATVTFISASEEGAYEVQLAYYDVASGTPETATSIGEPSTVTLGSDVTSVTVAGVCPTAAGRTYRFIAQVSPPDSLEGSSTVQAGSCTIALLGVRG